MRGPEESESLGIHVPDARTISATGNSETPRKTTRKYKGRSKASTIYASSTNVIWMHYIVCTTRFSFVMYRVR
jgi:hypothetical protein